MDLRLYSMNFTRLYIDHFYKSIYWTIKYNDVGSFVVQFDLKNDISPLILNYSGDLILQMGNLSGIMTSCRVDGDVLEVCGRTLNHLLKWAVTPVFSSLTNNVEVISRLIVSDALGTKPNFCLGSLKGFSSVFDFSRTDYNLTFDVVKECLDLDNAGHEIYFDVVNKKYVFNVLKGQTIFLALSEGNNNIYEEKYSQDFENYYNGGWYQKKQETGDPIWTLIDSTVSGWDKKLCILKGSDQSEANSDLLDKCIEKTFEVKTKNIKYATDYNLGDILTVKIKKHGWEKVTQKRVVGVNINYEYNNYFEQPILG